MKHKIKIYLQKALFWKSLPKKVRSKLQCGIYSSRQFKYHFKTGIFVTKGFNVDLIYTYEPPFSFRYYHKLFLGDYFPQKGDTIIDAGGFDGHFTCLLSKLVGDDGRVFTFECDPGNIHKCLKNFELNNLKNVDLIIEGLWSENSQIDFYSDSSVASSAFYSPPDSKKIIVNMTSVDEFTLANNILKLDFIKMNIEGSEIHAIKGARKTLDKLKPKLAITADHVVKGQQTYHQVASILDDLGYCTKIKRVGKGAIVVIGTPACL